MPKIFVFTASDRTPETTLIRSYAFYFGLVYKGQAEILALLYSLIFSLQNITFSEWAMLGSNQRPLPCEGSALPLS